MALMKLVTSTNGAQANYHRIQSIEKDCGQMTVILNCYTDSSYRQQEKEFAEMKKVINIKVARLSQLTGAGDDLTEEERMEMAELQNFVNNYSALSAHGPFHLYQSTISMLWEDTENISFQSIYEKLMENNEIFANAEKC